jgi:hypothetical protein
LREPVHTRDALEDLAKLTDETMEERSNFADRIARRGLAPD